MDTEFLEVCVRSEKSLIINITMDRCEQRVARRTPPYGFKRRRAMWEFYHKPSGKAHSIYGWDESEAIFSRINTLK